MSFIIIKNFIFNIDHITYVNQCEVYPTTIFVHTTNSDSVASIDFETSDKALEELRRLADVLTLWE